MRAKMNLKTQPITYFTEETEARGQGVAEPKKMDRFNGPCTAHFPFLMYR